MVQRWCWLWLMLDTSSLPSGNQTWQWKIPHEWGSNIYVYIYIGKSPLKGPFSIAMFLAEGTHRPTRILNSAHLIVFGRTMEEFRLRTWGKQEAHLQKLNYLKGPSEVHHHPVVPSKFMSGAYPMFKQHHIEAEANKRVKTEQNIWFPEQIMYARVDVKSPPEQSMLL